MLRYKREATITLHEASWIGIEIVGSQLGARVSLAWSSWSLIPHSNPRPVTGRP